MVVLPSVSAGAIVHVHMRISSPKVEWECYTDSVALAGGHLKTAIQHSDVPVTGSHVQACFQAPSVQKYLQQMSEIKNCFYDAMSTEKSEKIKYDFLVRSRLDSWWFQPFVMQHIVQSAHGDIVVPRILALDYWDGINDHFAMVPRKLALCYAHGLNFFQSSRLHKYWLYPLNNFTKRENCFNAESVLKSFLIGECKARVTQSHTLQMFGMRSCNATRLCFKNDADFCKRSGLRGAALHRCQHNSCAECDSNNLS